MYGPASAATHLFGGTSHTGRRAARSHVGMPITLPPRRGSGTYRRRAAVRAVLGVTAAAALAGVCFAAVSPGAAAAEGDVATSTLADLTVSDVPVAGLTAFHGVFGTAGSAPDAGLDEGDFSDPSGVLQHLTVHGNGVALTDAEPEKNYAQAQASGFTLALTRPDFLSVGSLDSYTECLPAPVGPLALAYAHTDSDEIDVLGHEVPPGTTRLDVTGAELGVDSVSTATLTVVYDRFEDPSGGAYQPVSSARAGLDITITGTFRDTDGAVAYDGPVTRLELGHVAVTCEAPTPTDTGTPTVTPTDTGTPTVTPTPTDTGTPTVTPTDTGTPTPTPTDTGTPTPTPTGTGTGTPTPPTPTPTGSESCPPSTTPKPHHPGGGGYGRHAGA